MTVILLIVALLGWLAAIIAGRQLYRWERFLRGTRVQVRFKGKAKMSPRLIDWLVWAQRLQGDKKVNGQVIYSQGGTTIALMRLPPKDHGKTATTTIKEPAA
jgi:hypothetical protein